MLNTPTTCNQHINKLAHQHINKLAHQHINKFQSYLEFWESISEDEQIMVDVLRQIVLEHLPDYGYEKLAYNVPFFYGKKRICLIWPASIPWGGIKEGVLFGFCHGNKLQDVNNYLTRGTNKQVFYKIFKSAEEINEDEIILLLKEACAVDAIK